ncbi:hypothetical protein T492DRAFT_110596 [Pavlovales sp. CCMP2436]|nr:hypothetical protein T492DRAFT_110596 [Pavlovales sp. CCMP2436]
MLSDAAVLEAGEGTHTSLVGTALYLDPHAMGGGGGGGSQEGIGGESGGGFRLLLKALDMYALGIVFFELNSKFGTAMERHVTLVTLRQTGEVPAVFAAAKSRQAALIRQLLNPNPRLRPSASSVLASELLPPVREDERTREAVRLLLSSPHSPFFAQLLDGLFHPQRAHMPLDVGWGGPRGASVNISDVSAGSSGGVASAVAGSFGGHLPARGHTGGHIGGAAGSALRESHATKRLVERLEGIFGLHGALCHEPPFLVPRPESDSDHFKNGGDAESEAILKRGGDLLTGGMSELGGGAAGRGGGNILIHTITITATAAAVTTNDNNYSYSYSYFL